MAERPTAPNTACVRKDNLPASRPASRGVRLFCRAWLYNGVAELLYPGRRAQCNACGVDVDVHALQDVLEVVPSTL